jgi:hypothetical protein
VNKARLRVEVFEDRLAPAYTNLGEGVSHNATSEPLAQSALVHTTQAATGTEFGQVVAATAHNPATFPG